MGSEKEDRLLQEVCYGAEDVAGEVELEEESDISFLILLMVPWSFTYFKIDCYTLNMCGSLYQFHLITCFLKLMH